MKHTGTSRRFPGSSLSLFPWQLAFSSFPASLVLTYNCLVSRLSRLPFHSSLPPHHVVSRTSSQAGLPTAGEARSSAFPASTHVTRSAAEEDAAGPPLEARPGTQQGPPRRRWEGVGGREESDRLRVTHEMSWCYQYREAWVCSPWQCHEPKARV